MKKISNNNYFRILQPSSLEWNSKLVEWLHKRKFRISGKLIDLGCGQGELVQLFKKLGYDAKGLDYPEIDLENPLKLPSNHYNYVICKFVFEHIRNIMPLMAEINRILKPGGKVVVLTDNSPANWKMFLNDPTHITPFTLERLKNLAKLNNLNVLECRQWRNIPYIWRYTIKAFDYSFPFSNQIIGIFQKKA
jgi:SAM-dependent methyltransferase